MIKLIKDLGKRSAPRNPLLFGKLKFVGPKKSGHWEVLD